MTIITQTETQTEVVASYSYVIDYMQQIAEQFPQFNQRFWFKGQAFALPNKLKLFANHLNREPFYKKLTEEISLDKPEKLCRLKSHILSLRKQ